METLVTKKTELSFTVPGKIKKEDLENKVESGRLLKIEK